MKAKKNKKDELLIELAGHVNIIEKKNGRVKSREKLDDKVVLEVLRNFIEDALRHALARYEAESAGVR